MTNDSASGTSDAINQLLIHNVEVLSSEEPWSPHQDERFDQLQDSIIQIIMLSFQILLLNLFTIALSLHPNCSPLLYQPLSPSAKTCKCQSGFIRNYLGMCVSIRGTRNLQAEPICNQNEVVENNICVCDSFSIPFVDSMGRDTCFKCLGGTFKADIQCLACPFFCLECNSAYSCEKCQEGLVFDPSIIACQMPQSLSNADSGLSGNPINNITCPSNMTNIDGQCVCDSHSVQFGLNSCFKCVGGSYKQNGMCTPCIDHCIDCNSSVPCITCQSPYVYLNQSCTHPFSTSCSENQILLNGVCVCDEESVQFQDACHKCPIGAFKDQQTKTCLPCPDACLSCISERHCLGCRGDYQLTNSECICSHPYYMISGNCQECPQGLIYDLQQKTCVLSANSNDLVLEPGQEVSCSQNQTLINGNCLCDNGSVSFGEGVCFRCVAGSYKQGNLCSPCIQNCLSCSSATTCTTCLDGYSYASIANQCKQAVCQGGKIAVDSGCECDSLSVEFQGNCLKCPAGAYKNLSTNTCMPCRDDCVTCENSSSCLQCRSRLTLDSKNECVCAPPRYMLQELCQQCPPGLAYDEGQRTCIVACQEGTYNSNGKCLACLPDCLSCADGVSCARCVVGFSFQQDRCLQSSNQTCLQNQVFSPLTNSCLCDNESIQDPFNPIQCLKCQQGTVKLNGSFCKACHQKCNVCSRELKCLQCMSGLVLNQLTGDCCGFSELYDSESRTCICLSGLVNISGICGTCPPGTLYFSQKKLCENSEQFNDVIPTGECGLNMELVDGKCKCNKRSYLQVQSKGCIFCGDGFFPNGNRCEPCMKNCILCFNESSCDQCIASHGGQTCTECSVNYVKIYGVCLFQLCGNGAMDGDESCDDGSVINGDGCSGECSTESGYVCDYSAALNRSECSLIFSMESIQITSAGVFVRLLSHMQRPRLSYDLVSGPKPMQVRISVSKRNHNSTIVFLDYGSSLPQERMTVNLKARVEEKTATYRLDLDLGSMQMIEGVSSLREKQEKLQ